MLRLYRQETTNFANDFLDYLPRAKGITNIQEINGEMSLEFDYPMNNIISENMIVLCEGQAYRITKIEQSSNDKACMRVSCEHVYVCDSKRKHIPTMPDFMGRDPRDILVCAFADTSFHVMTHEEAESEGLKSIGADGFLIDFFTVDKTTPYEVMQTVIKNCGRGEIYIDNFKIALVEKIGSDTDIRISTTENSSEITVKRDTKNLVTRLYPYGYNNADITSITPGGAAYIDSPNIHAYGIIEGYKDYSDYEKPEDIKNHAQWEFDENNENRIDIPAVTIIGKAANAENMELGDRVTVVDRGNKFRERVIRIVRYPEDVKETSVTIGRTDKDLFFYLRQLGHFGSITDKNTATNGKTEAYALSGSINTTKNKIESQSEAFKINDELMTIKNSGINRIEIGNVDGHFVFNINNEHGDNQIHMDDEGSLYISGALNTEQDCRVGDMLTIGKANNGYNMICFSSVSTPAMIIRDEESRSIMITNGKGTFTVKEDVLLFNGEQLAMMSDIDAVRSELDQKADNDRADTIQADIDDTKTYFENMIGEITDRLNNAGI